MEARLAPPPQVVWFRGGDAIKFLNDLISQEIGTVAPGSVVQSLLLDPQGKLDFLLWVLRGDDEVALVTEDGRADELVSRLSRYRIRVDVEIAMEESDIFLVVGRSGQAGEGFASDDDVLVADISWPNLSRELRIGGKKPDLPEIDPDMLTLARIEAGVPVVGVDLDEKTIPQEAGVVPETVSFNKGCFLGQELVARLDSRGGRVNRHLRLLDLEEPVAEGTVLTAGEREVGTLTSASGNTGLALLWREVEPGDEIRAGDTAVRVRDIPQKTAGSFTGS
jgi:tRNA-modifying protein YgfZ